MPKKQHNLADLKLSKQLIKNLTHLVTKSGLTQIEIANLAKIPPSTLNGIITSSSINPKLHTLASISRVFDVQIAQLIGELPLNLSETVVPILKWKNLDTENNAIHYKIDENTEFLSTKITSANLLFALYTNNNISNFYKKNSLIIVEKTNLCENNDLAILSIEKSNPTIKKIVKEGNTIFLESISNNIPIQKFDNKKAHIFGIIKESRC